ncbi:MAG: hypothetical protein JNG86_20840 [Verrucomicrobiaceae bacterium]|nr:hypothetical protein [Verrucomicrobiaceae bacterium]
MPAYLRRLIHAICLSGCVGAVCGQEAAKPSGFSVSPFIITVDQTPAEFLDLLGKTAKARWRLLFRPPPPTPPTGRAQSALILGTLIAESYLIWQAGDAQQFRNTNQDIVSYCRTLGVAEKLMPCLMAQGKMAESEQWKELQLEIADGHQDLLRLLREMQDEDLALLIDTGLWLRILEIASKLAAESPVVEARPLCVGAPNTLQEMRDRFDRISEKQRQSPLLQRIQTTLQTTHATWLAAANTAPDPNVVIKTHRSLEALMQSVWEKEK